MHNQKKPKYFLILANFSYSYIILLFFVGVFLFPKTAYLSTITPEKIIQLTNKERIENNLNPLTANQFLTQAAYNKAIDIFKNQQFDHNFGERRFSAWIKDVNYKYRYVGENLAIDFVSSEAVVKAWISSPTHYENLINNKFKEIGVAVVEDNYKGENSIVVVQIFGTPLENNLDVNFVQKEQNSYNKNTDFLTHIRQEDLDILDNKNVILDFQDEKDFGYTTENKNNKKTPDIFFTFIGVIYLGIFKLVSIKNIGL